MDMHHQHFDIIIAGTGLAGLTLALECARRPFFQQRKILLIDRDTKTKNDRTWCFWATNDEIREIKCYKTWDKAQFFEQHSEVAMDMGSYRYCMVRGIDFYQSVKEELALKPNIQQICANIESIDAATGTVHTDQGNFTGTWVFNSALTPLPLLPLPDAQYPNPPFTRNTKYEARNTKHHTWLLQHFKGWTIETPIPAFDPETITFMDYRIEQRRETRFVYVLPFSENRALVEFTVFSEALCEADEYEQVLRGYIRNQLNISDFKVEEEEFGVIPMTDYPFPWQADGHVIPIGTVGGFVKASSGYAFKRTQRKIRALLDAWEKTGAPDPSVMRSPRIFRILDSIMLRVLGDRLLAGHILFTRLFQRLKATLVFRFLDEDATFVEILRLLKAPPAPPFLKALWRQLGRLWNV